MTLENEILVIGQLTCSMDFSSIGELSSKLISDKLYANFETLCAFSICHYDYYIDEGPFSFLFYQVY